MDIKVCGMNNTDNLEAIANFQPDYFGFIFYDKSPRCLSLDSIPVFQHTNNVGVFVDESIDVILQMQKRHDLHGIQLHGNESVEKVKEIRNKLPLDVEIFKAISVIEAEDFVMIEKYENYVDVFVLDTKTKLKGGSGKKFNWDLLKYYNTDLPFLLSGGIGPNDFDAVNNIYENHRNMLGVDLNSKFEVEPGLKNVEVLENFIMKLKR